MRIPKTFATFAALNILRMKDFLKYTLATICGLLVFSIISSFFGLMILGGIAAMSEESPTEVKPHSVYVLDLDGALVDRAEENPMEAFSALMGSSTPTQIGLDDVLRNIEIAKVNPNIAGIYLRGSSLGAGYASLSAIRRALVDFKESGKFIVAYAQDYTQSNYYLASVADSIFCNEHGTVSWSGLYAQATFFSRALEKIGVEMQVLKVGTFKSAVEPYILTEMSDANRLQMKTYADEIWSTITSAVSESRGISVAQLNALADQQIGLQPEHLLFTSGLVDGGIYQQEMEKKLATLTDTEDYRLVSHKEMNSIPDTPILAQDKVAVLYATGEITDSEGDGIVGTKLVKEINKLAKDDKVKAVVLRVNSPGGSASASEQIWHALSLLKEKKPLIVSMGEYAASGGYYISCLADTIVAEENTLTGSIGIFGLVPNISGLANKIGVDFDGVGTNKLSGMEANMVYEGMNREERQLMQAMINRGYELFVKRCADGRGMSTDAIKAIAEGRVWTGKHAEEIGLVDCLGGLDKAIEIAVAKAGVSDYALVNYPKETDQLTTLLEMLGETPSEPERIYLQVKQLTEKGPQVIARLPFEISVK